LAGVVQLTLLAGAVGVFSVGSHCFEILTGRMDIDESLLNSGQRHLHVAPLPPGWGGEVPCDEARFWDDDVADFALNDKGGRHVEWVSLM
jgi:hypothetical protein